MIPVLWRYLVASFFRIFILSVSSFIAVLLVMRLEEIARFASSGPGWENILLFAFYQIPYILPIAMPVSCLIAAFLLFQQMSASQEITSLRAAGLGLGMLTAPLIFISTLLCISNFVISAELAPIIRGQSKKLILEVTASNPLALLQKDALIKFKQAFLDMRTSSSSGNATDVLFVAKNTSTGKLGMMVAKELTVHKGDLCGKHVSFISSIDPKAPDRFDHLVIENQTEMDTPAANLSQFWESPEWQLNDDYLPLRLLLGQEKMERGSIFSRIGKPQVEFIRRYSLAFATITFTFLGLSFGMQIGRRPSKKSLGWVIGLALLFFMIFVSAKSMKNMPTLAFFQYILPHPIILLASLFAFRRRAKGVEG